jgi:ABC-type nitrate/sulfonate/bicarbonate transport system substrate-binding protein
MVKRMIIFLLGILILLTSCRKEPDQVAVQLDWIHGVHFAGLYVAIEKGFYDDENISVSLHEGGPLINVNVLDTFIDEEPDFGVFTMWHIISSRKKELDLIALLVTFQIPPEVLFSLKESGIQSPNDMVGKRVGVKNPWWREIIHDTLAAAGIKPEDIIEIDAKSIDMLYTGKIDIWTGFAYNEPNEARLEGFEINQIFAADYGLGNYSGLLCARKEMIEQNPDLVVRFVKASQKGWAYAIEHPDEAADIVSIWQSQKNLSFHRFAMHATIPLVDTGYVPFGWIDDDRWKREMGDAYDPDNPGYTMRFLQTKQKP